jgi:hypothetical protein
MSFLPTDVANLQLWLKADAGVYHDAGTTLATNGQTVQQWNDQSGNSRHASQATSGNRPGYNTSAKNSLPAIRFASASSQYLSHSYTGELGTAFVVYRNNDATTGGALISGDTSDAVADAAYYLIPRNSAGTGVTNKFYGRVTTADTGGAATWNGTSGALTGVYDLVAIRNTGSVLKQYEFDILTSTANIPGGQTVRPINSGYIGMAPYSRNPGSYLQGDVLEYIVYNPNISDTDFASVIAYLTAKWNLKGSGKYLMAGFKGQNNDDFLYTFRSNDGVDFNFSPTNYLPPATHLCRDFGFCQMFGKYWILHAICDTGAPSGYLTHAHQFDVAYSTDTSSWTFLTSVDITTATGASTGGAWTFHPIRNFDGTPWFDGSGLPHFMFGASSDNQATASLWEIHPTDQTMTTWSTPVQMTGTSLPSVMYDPYCLYDGTTFSVWYGNAVSPNHYIEMMSSTTMTSGYTVQKSGNFAGWGNTLEHPCLIRNADGTWTIYVDQLGNLCSYATGNAAWSSWSGLTSLTYDGGQAQSSTFKYQGAEVFASLFRGRRTLSSFGTRVGSRQVDR